MGELRDIKDAVQPSDTLLVVDAMTGQEAASLVRSFNEAASLTGARTAYVGKAPGLKLPSACRQESMPWPGSHVLKCLQGQTTGAA